MVGDGRCPRHSIQAISDMPHGLAGAAALADSEIAPISGVIRVLLGAAIAIRTGDGVVIRVSALCDDNRDILGNRNFLIGSSQLCLTGE